jgi:Putative peptidoglycan binding domain
MAYGDRDMRLNDTGPDVAELQMRLAGFRGTIPDGQFGAGTQLQVTKFQEDVMAMRPASGVADRATLEAIAAFAKRYPIDFAALKCPCGVCDGFGRGQFKGVYRPGTSKTEQNYLYEYPGIHRMVLWALRAVFFYCERDYKFAITSGYRCSERNKQQGRTARTITERPSISSPWRRPRQTSARTCAGATRYAASLSKNPMRRSAGTRRTGNRWSHST